MPECKVTCYTCRTPADRPKVWHWLCEDCAVDCLDSHRRATGHTDLNLAVVTASAAIREMARQASVVR